MIRRASLLLAIVIAGPAAAQYGLDSPEPGVSYGVANVARSDVLNVRRAAGDAEVLATLPANALGIVVTGRVQPVGDSPWWEIVLPGIGGETGWVNARFLSPTLSASGQEASGYALHCLGTEPFWSLALSDDSAVFSSPSDPERPFSAGAWLPAEGLRDQFAVRLTSPEGAGYAAVRRERSSCSDNMSDLSYPFGVTLILPGDRVLGGCCSRAAP
jgi:uncharacterized membrane protein